MKLYKALFWFHCYFLFLLQRQIGHDSVPSLHCFHLNNDSWIVFVDRECVCFPFLSFPYVRGFDKVVKCGLFFSSCL